MEALDLNEKGTATLFYFFNFSRSQWLDLNEKRTVTGAGSLLCMARSVRPQ